MHDYSSPLHKLLLDNHGQPLRLYLDTESLSRADVTDLADDIVRYGGTVCPNIADADMILVDPKRCNNMKTLLVSHPRQIILNKNWLKFCIVGKEVLAADKHWAGQLIGADKSWPAPPVEQRKPPQTLPPLREMDWYNLGRKTPREPPSTSRGEDFARSPSTLTPAHAYSPASDSRGSSIPRGYNQGSASQEPRASGALPSPTYYGNEYRLDRGSSIPKGSKHGSALPDPRASRDPPSPTYYRNEYLVADSGRPEYSPTPDDRRYALSPHSYRLPYPYSRYDEAAPTQQAAGRHQRDYYDCPQPEALSFQYIARSGDVERAEEDRRRIEPPRAPSHQPDPAREDRNWGKVMESSHDKLYREAFARNDAAHRYDTSPWSRTRNEPSPSDYLRPSPAPRDCLSPSPGSQLTRVDPERPDELRVFQYDPNSKAAVDRPHRVYRGGYPVESKADSMVKPSYIMSDGRVWTVDDPEPPPLPEVSSHKDGSKRHNQYSEAEDWFLVHYANWLMRHDPKLEMNVLYDLVHEKMKNHSKLALYLRVNKSQGYFRRLGMTEMALARRHQQPRKKKPVSAPEKQWIVRAKTP